MEVSQYNLFILNNSEIRYVLGNFGKVPYGKTLLGKIYYIPQKDGSNYWCKSEILNENKNLYITDPNEYVPIYFVDHSTDCSYAHKAVNVQNMNGKVMLIASDSNIIEEEYNVDDIIEKPSIPTIIIAKDFADIIREYSKYSIKNNNKEDKNIILNMKFSGVKESGKVELELFFRSDDTKVLNFFQDFNYYKKILGDKLVIKPYYKYSRYVNEQFSNELSDKIEYPCVKDFRMCSGNNRRLNVNNPRTILLENIRQSCIFQEFGKEIYWTYMIIFGEICVDLKNPEFTQNCASKVLNMSLIDNMVIHNCMKNMIEKNGKIESDFDIFEKRKIYSVPDLYINGVPYRGTWFAKYIFNTICNGFLDDNDICGSENPSNIIYSRRVNVGLVIILSLIIFGVLIITLLYYKRYINKDLENIFNSKIEEYTMKSISQYKAFSSEGPKSSKLEMAN